MAKNAKRWSYKTGEKGRNRVRAYEEGKSGLLYLEYYAYDPKTGAEKRERVSLGHRDREKAKRQADQLAADFAAGSVTEDEPVTLQALFDIYGREVTPTKSERQRNHDRCCMELFCRFFGGDRPAHTLNRRDWDRFIHQRRSGTIDARGRAVPVAKRKERGNRTVARDLKFLMAVLNWATVARNGSEGILLERNPCKGFPYPKAKNPARPIVTQERYEAMLQVASEVDWRFELALVLAHETGHRISAIRRLRWSDVELERQRVRWRAESDKIGEEHLTPLSDTAQRALREAQEARPAIGNAWVFPAPEDTSEPCSRHLMRDWWLRGEELAGLDHIKGLGWHGLRRKFATEMKELPLKTLCDMGGWKTHRTIIECYQQTDMAAMRQALTERGELREAGSQ